MPPRRTVVPEPPTLSDVKDVDLVKAAISTFDSDFEGLNLHGKIARISGYVGSIPKRGYNAFHKYNYVMEADLVSAVRQYLATAGIVMIPDTEWVTREGDLTTINVRYTVSDGKESFSFAIPGSGSDKGDKGIYKALTGSQKYAIMKLFKIETGDDPEQDTRVDERAAQGESSPQSRPVVTSGSRDGVGRGGHTEKVSPAQLRRISEQVRALQLERPLFAALINDVVPTLDKIVLPEDDDEQQLVLLAILKDRTSEEGGKILEELDDLAAARLKEEGPGGNYS